MSSARLLRDRTGNDVADTDIVACGGWRKSGPGPLVYVFAHSGAVLESHPLPADLPMRCAFGGAELDDPYVTSLDGCLYRAESVVRQGLRREVH